MNFHVFLRMFSSSNGPREPNADPTFFSYQFIYIYVNRRCEKRPLNIFFDLQKTFYEKIKCWCFRIGKYHKYGGFQWNRPWPWHFLCISYSKWKFDRAREKIWKSFFSLEVRLATGLGFGQSPVRAGSGPGSGPGWGWPRWWSKITKNRFFLIFPKVSRKWLEG